MLLAAGTSIVVVKESHLRITPLLARDSFPQTLAELDAWYVEPPAGQNAATFDLQGIRAMQIQGADQNTNLPVLGKLPSPSSSRPLPPPVKSALTTFIQQNSQALQFFAQGAQYDQSRYPIDLSQGEDVLLTYLTGIKRATQLELMATMLDANNNDGQKVADDIVNALALADSLKAEPVLISQLVRVADISIAVGALNYSVNRTTLSSDSLSTLLKVFQNEADYDARGEGFNRAYVGEKVNHMALLQNRGQLLSLLNQPGSFGQTQDANNRVIQYVNRTADLKEEQDYLESTFQQLMAARQKNFPERLQDTIQLIQQRVADARKRGLLIYAMYWDGVDSAVPSEAHNLAEERLAITALALEQFRVAHNGQYPASLSSLVPVCLDAIPADPFDGKPLRYERRDAGYMLFSIGNKGKISFLVTAPPPL